MENTREKIQRYMESNKLSQAATAKLLGVGESTFSRYLKADYPNPEMVEKKITDLLQKEQLRQEVTKAKDIPFAPTTTANTVMNVLEYSRVQKTIGVIYGDAGIGKTRTIQEWAKGKTDVVIITAAPALNSPKSFLKCLAKELRTPKAGHIDDLYLEIMDRLIGTDKIIIVDEAQHLSIKTLENMRSLQDATGISLVFVGNDMVYTKMVGKQQAEFAQLFSRIGIRKHLLTDQFTKEDVEQVFGELAEEISEILLKICRSKYGLRGAIHVFINSSNNKDVSVKGIRAMARMMGIIV